MFNNILQNITIYFSKYMDKLDSTALLARFAKGAVWAILGAIISRGLTLLASICVARILGQSEFGQLGMIQSTVGTLGTFAGLGLGMTATKYVASLRATSREKAGKILALLTLVSYITTSIFCSVLILGSPKLADNILKAPNLTLPLQIAAGLMLFSVINGVQTGALAGFEAFRVIAKVNFIVGIISFPLITVGAFYYGLTGTVIGLTAAMSINCWLNNRGLKQVTRKQNIIYSYATCLEERNVLICFTLPSALSSFIIAPVMWYSNVLLANQPNGYMELGIFNAAQQWQTALLFLPTTVAPAILSMLSSMNGSIKNNKDFWKMVKLSFLINSAITGGGALIISFLSHLIMKTYGAGFSTGAGVLIVLSLVAFLCSTSNVIGQIIASSDSMWWGFLLNLLWTIAFIVFSQLFIRSFGAFGLAISYAAAYLCHIMWSFLYLYFKNVRNRKWIV
jgi:O-antigen/teichoic acid export membrane protein